MAQTTTPEPQHQQQRSMPPIRWPKPNAPTVLLLLLYAAGVAVAVLVPAFIVPPGLDSVDAGPAWVAFGFTMLGTAVLVVAGLLLHRRTREAGVLVFTYVPAFTLVIGGIMMLATKVPLA